MVQVGSIARIFANQQKFIKTGIWQAGTTWGERGEDFTRPSFSVT
jgi:hypothetical protein